MGRWNTQKKQSRREKKESKRERIMNKYWDSTSRKLLTRWDAELKKTRKETNEERQERLLGHNMPIKSSVGLENDLLSKEINEGNLRRPVRTIPVTGQQQETSIPSETEQGWVLIDDGMTVIPESHPLWMSRANMIWNAYIREFQNKDLNVDKYGFSEELIGNIRRAPETWRQNLARGTTRNQKFPGHHSDAERILLATQVSLSLSLSSINTLASAVTDVCKRLSLYREETNEPEWRTRIAHRVKGWQAKYDIKTQIHPAPKRQGGKGHELNQEDRRLLKQDFDSFRSYNFNVTDSAELANKIHGTNRLGETIKGWFVNGVPKIKTKPSNGTASEVTMTNEPKESPVMDEGPVMDPRTQEWGLPPVNAGETCPNCMTTCTECGHNQNSVHCADNLVSVGWGYVKIINNIRDETLEFREGIIESARDEAKRDVETETTHLKEQVAKLLGTEQTSGSVKFYQREAKIAEKARNEADTKVHNAETELTTLKRKVSEQEHDLKEQQTKIANLLLNKTGKDAMAKEMETYMGRNAKVSIEVTPEDLPPPTPIDHQRTA